MSYICTGIPPGPAPGLSEIWTPERKAEVKRMALNRLTYSQIGKVMGVSRCAIGGIIGRMKNTGDYPSLAPRKVRMILRPLHKANKVRVDGNNNLSAAKLPSYDERLLRPAQGKGKIITELDGASCRFPTGFNKKGAHIFCAAETDGSSWCATHEKRVFKSGVVE